MFSNVNVTKYVPQKMWKKCQICRYRMCSFKLQIGYTKNSFPPRAPLGEITTLPRHSSLEVCGNGFQYSQSLPFPRGHSHSHSRNLCIVKPIPIPILFPKAHSHSLPFPFPRNHLRIETFQKRMCVMSFAFTDYESEKQDELNTSIRISVTIASIKLCRHWRL